MTRAALLLPHPRPDPKTNVYVTHDDLISYRDCMSLLVNVYGLTQGRIADLIGINQSVISRRCHGHKYPNREPTIVMNVLVARIAADPDFEGWIIE